MSRLRPSFFLHSFCIAGALLFSQCALAENREWVHYAELAKKLWLDKFYATPAEERSALLALVTLKADNTDHIELQIPSANGPVVLRTDAEGTTVFPFSEELMREDPMILTNVPTGTKTKMSINIQPKIALKEDYAVAELAKPIDQANAMAKKQLGLLSFVVPTIKTIVLKFDPAANATAQLITKDAGLIKADATGVIKIPINAALRTPGARVVLSQKPLSADLED